MHAWKAFHLFEQRTLTLGRGSIATADLLFDWFGFDKTSKAVANST